MIRNLVGDYVTMEGIFFSTQASWSACRSSGAGCRRPGTLIRYVLKDESINLAFGVDLASAIVAENPQVKPGQLILGKAWFAVMTSTSE